MPWKSTQQAAWGHSPAGLRALGGQQKVAEWDQATAKGSLPERAPAPPPQGGLREAAKRAKGSAQ